MKKIIILLGTLIFFQFGFSLSCIYRGYKIEEGKVYYYKGQNKIELGKADSQTFEVIRSVNYSILAKDKKNVYYDGKLLENVNSKTFFIIEEIVPPDKGPWKYGCGSSGYIIKDKNKTYELKEVF